MVSENEFLLHALLMGIYITFVYDLLRIFRRLIAHNSFFVSLEDLGFWIYCGAKVFLLMYHESDGTLRWFAVLGALTGMLLYMKLVSKLLVKYSTLILQKLLGILRKILGFILKPFGVLGRKVAVKVNKGSSRFGIFRKRVKRAVKLRLTYLKKMLRINLRA